MLDSCFQYPIIDELAMQEHPDDEKLDTPRIPKSSVPSAFRRRLKKIFDNAIAEGVNTFFFILLLAAARWLVEHLFTESKFFDYIPVRYLFDVGDIAVIGRFIWNTLKGEE